MTQKNINWLEWNGNMMENIHQAKMQALHSLGNPEFVDGDLVNKLWVEMIKTQVKKHEDVVWELLG